MKAPLRSRKLKNKCSPISTCKITSQERMASVEQIISGRDLLLEVTYILEPNFKGRETDWKSRGIILKSPQEYIGKNLGPLLLDF